VTARGQLVSASLRPGHTPAARGAGAVLARLLRRVKGRCPACQMVVRGDGGCGSGRLLKRLDWRDAELGGIAYLLGLAHNPAL
jgi:Transposase DDE domain group 1